VFESFDPKPCAPSGLCIPYGDGASWMGENPPFGWVFRSPKKMDPTVGGLPGTTVTPLPTWEDQVSYQARVVDAEAGTALWSSGEVASALPYFTCTGYDHAAGEYILWLKVKDSEGLWSDEVGLNYTILPGTPPVYGPTVAILWPVAEDTYAETVTVRASVTQGSAAISGVTLSVDGGSSVAMTDQGGGLWTYDWDTTDEANGGHVLRVTAADEDDLTATASVHVLVENDEPPANSIAIIAPSEGEIVRGPYTLSAQTNEAGAVSFALDGTSLGSATITGDRASLVYDFTDTTPGSYVLTATAPSSAQDSVRFTVADVGQPPDDGTSADSNAVNVITFADQLCHYCGGPAHRDPDSAALKRQRGFCADCADFYGLAQATDCRTFFQSPTIPEVATE